MNTTTMTPLAEVLAPIGGLELLVLLLVLPMMALWLWSLIHCIRNPWLSDTNRVIGIVLIAVLGIVGSFVYLFLPREAR